MAEPLDGCVFPARGPITTRPGPELVGKVYQVWKPEQA